METETKHAPINFLERSKILENNFIVTTEVDQVGFKRHVYSYGEISFSFRGKEELPIHKSIKDFKTVFVGSDPTHVDKDDYAEYKTGLIQNRDKATQKSHYLATKDLEGVISLAINLGSTDPNLEKTLKEVRLGGYSGKSLDLIDKLIAANCITDDQNLWEDSLSGADAEALVILSLLGDNEANEYLDSKLEEMRKLDMQRESQDKTENEFPVDINKQACVHATRFRPVVNSDGSHEVKTLSDATNFEFLRNTIHVSLNHKVVSHMMGKWDQAPYVLISPMKKMVDINGPPISDQEWDTWWTRNPGETLKFPDAVLVEPGEMPFNTLFVIGEKKAIFKGDDYTVDDWLKAEKLTGSRVDILRSFRSILFADFSEHPEIYNFLEANWDIEKLSQILIEKHFPNESYPGERKGESFTQMINFGNPPWEDVEKFEQTFKNPGKTPITDKIASVLEKDGIQSAFKRNKKSMETATKKLAKYISEKIEGEIFAGLTSLVTKEVVRKMGFEPTGGGNWPSAHAESPYNWLTRGHVVAIDEAKETLGVDEMGEKIKGKFIWNKFEPVWKTLPKIDSKTRRVMHASGAFNSRE